MIERINFRSEKVATMNKYETKLHFERNSLFVGYLIIVEE